MCICDIISKKLTNLILSTHHYHFCIMKKGFILTALAVTLALTGAQAQTAGRMFLGGMASFSSTTGKTTTTFGTTTVSTDAPKVTQGGIMPTFGYFVTDNVVAGVGVGYSSTTSETSGTNSSDTRAQGDFNVMPYVRYANKIGDKLLLWGELNVPISSGTAKRTQVNTIGGTTITTETTSATSGFGVGVQPGLTFFLADNFAIEAKFGRLGYSRNTNTTPATGNDNKTVDESSTFGLSLDARTLSFGLHYYFGGK